MSKKREHHKLFMVGSDAPFQFTEAYKSLRTNLEFLAATSDCKTILITSSVPGEGKSNVAVNLAITLADSGKRVVLVDHNEMAQAVPGLEQAEILEIIDHHRLADIQTTQPIRMRNEPVGSTTTIITNMYQEHGVMPSPNMAGLMAGAILSDTVMFKSPTCTKRDIAMAERMARIANVSLKELGNLLFAASSAGDKSADELCFTEHVDYGV